MSPSERPLILDVIFDRWLWRILILLSSLLAAVTGLAAPWFQKEFIDHLTGSVPHISLGWFSDSVPWVVLAFVAMLFSQGFSQLTSYLGSREAIFLQQRFSRRLYEKMLSLRADTLSRHSLGEAVSLYATDVPGATVFIDQTLPMGASTLFPLILAPFALAEFFQTPLLPTVLLILAIAAINTALAFRQSRFFYHFKQLAAERTGLVNEWIQNIRTLRILGWTAAFEKAIFRKRIVETDNRVRMVTNGQIMNSISTSVTFFLNIATLAVLTLWSKRHLSPGEILAVLWVLGVFLTRPFRQMPWFFTFGFDAWTSLRRLQHFLDTENRGTRPSERLLPDPVTTNPEPALEVGNLRLVVNDNVLLDDVSFSVKPGEFVAIVGEVGSGKTLLLLSLLRETGATFGRYRLGNRDALQMTDEELRGHFSFVPQEGFIMSANLRDNVIFDYDTDPSHDAAVTKSLKAAQFELSRERVERGLETEIGERGVNLSGGQRQRVSLARVHYARGPFLLLDDCLSAVDVDTEEKLLAQLLNGEWKHRTRLLVTHRLTVLDQVDRILFFKDGRLLDQGHFAELNERSRDFRDFTVSVRRMADHNAATAFLPPTVPIPASEPLPPLTVEKVEDES